MALNIEPHDFGRKKHERREAFRSAEAIAGLIANVEALSVSGSYVPTLTGCAVGTGGSAANFAFYERVGNLLFVEGHFIFGTSGVTFPTGAVDVGLPSGMTIAQTNFLYENPSAVHFVDANGPDFIGTVGPSTATAVRVYVTNAAATYDARSQTTNVIPFTWAAADGVFYQYMLRVT